MESVTEGVISDAFSIEGRTVYSVIFFVDTVGAASKATTKNNTHIFSGIFIYHHPNRMMKNTSYKFYVTNVELFENCHIKYM